MSNVLEAISKLKRNNSKNHYCNCQVSRDRFIKDHATSQWVVSMTTRLATPSHGRKVVLLQEQRHRPYIVSRCPAVKTFLRLSLVSCDIVYICIVRVCHSSQ